MSLTFKSKARENLEFSPPGRREAYLPQGLYHLGALQSRGEVFFFFKNLTNRCFISRFFSFSMNFLLDV